MNFQGGRRYYVKPAQVVLGGDALAAEEAAARAEAAADASQESEANSLTYSQNSANSAASSAGSAGAAAVSETNAGVSEDNAAASAVASAGSATASQNSANDSQDSADDAFNSAFNAAGSVVASGINATNSANSATASAVSAGESAASAVVAEAAEDGAVAIYDEFDDRYLGAFAVAPTLDNDGDPLTLGALYFHDEPPSSSMRVWNGTSWQPLPTSGSTAASAITVTPAGNIASTNVQAALQELDTEKVAKAGDIMTGPLRLPNGTNGAPALTFDSDPDTGIYSGGGNVIRIATGGTQRVSIGSSGIDFSLIVRGTDGTAASPTYTFSNDADTGMYRIGTDTLGFSTGTTLRLTLSTTALTSTLPIVLPADPTTALQAATKQYVDLRELASNKGAVNGYAPLDASTKVPAAYLPAYVDDVLEFANLAAFPATGTAGIIYVALDTNKTYRWGGSAYTEISPSPGSTDVVPEGATNLYFTDARAISAVTPTINSSIALKVDKTANTGAAVTPVGNTAQRPGSPTAGHFRYNSEISKFEGYSAGAWGAIGGGATIGDAAPSNPSQGQLWWESDSGSLNLWYEDGTSNQWVGLNGGGLPEAPVDGKTYGRKNNGWTESLDPTTGVLKTGDTMTGPLQVGGSLAFAPYPTAVVSGGMYLQSGALLFNGAYNTSAIIKTIAAGRTAQITFEPVNGNFILQTTSSVAAGATAGAAGNAFGYQASTGQFTLYQSILNSAGSLAVQTGGVSRMTVSNNGGIVVSQPNTDVAGIVGYSGTASTAVNCYGVIGFASGGAIYGGFGVYVVGQGTWSVYGNSSAYISSGTWQTSDGLLKAETGAFSPDKALANIKAIQVRKYKPASKAAGKMLVSSESTGAEEQTGWFAQDIEALIPEAVRDMPVPPDDPVQIEAAGGLETLKAINLYPLVAQLWAAVQALSAKIDAMEKK